MRKEPDPAATEGQNRGEREDAESHPCGFLQEERASLTGELHSLREQRGRLHAELETYRECDPEVVQEIRRNNLTAKEAVNRWTDNVFAIKSWAKRKFGFEDSRLNKAFGIPEEFDYLD